MKTRVTLTTLAAFTRSSNVLDLDKLDDGLVHALDRICTHHFWSAGSVSLLQFYKRFENGNGRMRRGNPTQPCGRDMCAKTKRRENNNSLLNQDGIDYLQAKHPHVRFKLFFAVSACGRWPGSACPLEIEL